MRTNAKIITAVFDPAARGEWSLPAELTGLRDDQRRLEVGLRDIPQPPSVDQVHADAVRTARTATNPAITDVSMLVQYDQTVREYELRVVAVRTALDQVTADLTDYLREHGDDLITGTLQPTLAKLWAQVVKASAVLDGVELRTDVLLIASDKARRAYVELDTMAARYATLRTAWSWLRQPVQHDGRDDHAEFARGNCSLWPHKTNGIPVGPPPWPTDDGRARLVWWARNGLQPWLPTAEQQDKAWSAVDAHREQLERVQHQNDLGRQAHSWGKSLIADGPARSPRRPAGV